MRDTHIASLYTKTKNKALYRVVARRAVVGIQVKTSFKPFLCLNQEA